MSSEVFGDDTLEHRCASGHYWREHTNGQVTPSWGFGGTFVDVADPTVCPEPTLDADGLYPCPSCGQSHRPGEGLRGMSFAPWEFGPGKRQECAVPTPGCGKPAMWTRRWGDRSLPWPDGPGALYSLWYLSHRVDGERLVAYISGRGDSSQVIDLRTGEPLRIAHGDPAWIAQTTRRATVRDAPEALRASWPRESSPSEGGGVSTTWLLAHTNADYVALCRLHDRGVLAVPDHEREFMWAVLAAAEGDGLAAEIRSRVREDRWPVADVEALVAVHAETAAEAAASLRGELAPAGVQMGLGF